VAYLADTNLLLPLLVTRASPSSTRRPSKVPPDRR
jgi:hypothetical protein